MKNGHHGVGGSVMADGGIGSTNQEALGWRLLAMLF